MESCRHVSSHRLLCAEASSIRLHKMPRPKKNMAKEEAGEQSKQYKLNVWVKQEDRVGTSASGSGRKRGRPVLNIDKETVDPAKSTKFRKMKDLCMCSVQNILEYYPREFYVLSILLLRHSAFECYLGEACAAVVIHVTCYPFLGYWPASRKHREPSRHR